MSRSKGWYGSLWLCLGMLCCVSSVQAIPVVERISFASQGDGSGYVVRIHTTEQLQAYSEPRFVGIDKLELILFNTDISPHFHRDEPAGPVHGYTLEQHNGHLYLRFQLDEVRVEAQAYRDRLSKDMLLGLTYRQDRSATMPVPTRTAATETRRDATGRPVVAPVPQDDAADVVDARERWRLDTIVIDAGHGGHDAGAIGAGGVREKDVVLPVALKVGRYIEEQLGVRVVYTRADDQFVTLANRGHIANRAGGKLFISIHANAASNRSAAGAETFFLGLHKSDAARKVMERENSVVNLESDPDAYKRLDEQALIVQTLAQSAYMRKSEQLAGLIQDQFEEHVGRKNRGVKQAGFYVLWSASMPSILVELGFVTNPAEAAFLKSEAGQDYLASAIFRAVRDYKAQYEKGLELVIR